MCNPELDFKNTTYIMLLLHTTLYMMVAYRMTVENENFHLGKCEAT